MRYEKTSKMFREGVSLLEGCHVECVCEWGCHVVCVCEVVEVVILERPQMDQTHELCQNQSDNFVHGVAV
jgi:hypothetical protein